MIAGVTDTHAAVWLFSRDPRLSGPAKEFFFKTAAARRKIALSSISLAEVIYLIEKNRLPASAYEDLKQALANPNHVLEEAPFNAEVVEFMRHVPRVDVPDMPDRIVAATGLYFGVPVISRDGRIRASDIQTVW
jgi:PIN domain nuclease of toxin-antitoxin system